MRKLREYVKFVFNDPTISDMILVYTLILIIAMTARFMAHP